MTSFRSRCQVVSTELFPPVVVVPSAKIQFPSLGRKTYRHSGPSKFHHSLSILDPLFLFAQELVTVTDDCPDTRKNTMK